MQQAPKKNISRQLYAARVKTLQIFHSLYFNRHLHCDGVQSSKVDHASTSTAPKVTGPPIMYNHIFENKERTNDYIKQNYPQLQKFVDKGILYYIPRPANYVERRTDGYIEPEHVFLIGTSHVSSSSCEDVATIIRSIQPDNVVVEVCRNRAALLYQTTNMDNNTSQQNIKHQQGLSNNYSASQEYTDTKVGADVGQRQSVPESSVSASTRASADSIGPDASKYETSEQCQVTGTQKLKGGGSNGGRGVPNEQAVQRGGIGDTFQRIAQQQLARMTGKKYTQGDQDIYQANKQRMMDRPPPPPFFLFVRALLQRKDGSYTVPVTFGGSLLRILLGAFFARAANVSGLTPGLEMAVARQEANACGAQVVLGDRPINITLTRAWHALPWNKRVRLIAQLLAIALGISKQSFGSGTQIHGQPDGDVGSGRMQGESQQVTRGRQHEGDRSAVAGSAVVEGVGWAPSDEMLDNYMTAFAEEYEELMGALFYERDRYLAWSLKRSKAVCGCSTVVGVVGFAHVRGVLYALQHDQQELRFKHLTAMPNSTKQNIKGVAVYFLVELGVLAAAYGVYSALQLQ